MTESTNTKEPGKIDVQVNIGGGVFDQEGQTVEHVENYVQIGNKRVPLSEATPEQQENFYKAFPAQRPKTSKE